MGYSFFLISKEKEISKSDFKAAMANLSEHNRNGLSGGLVCDVDFQKSYIRVSGSFGLSGNLCEGFVLNLLVCLTQLGYSIKVLSKDFEYGSQEDWQWLVTKLFFD